jgi:hypothetical protein
VLHIAGSFFQLPAYLFSSVAATAGYIDLPNAALLTWGGDWAIKQHSFHVVPLDSGFCSLHCSDVHLSPRGKKELDTSSQLP